MDKNGILIHLKLNLPQNMCKKWGDLNIFYSHCIHSFNVPGFGGDQMHFYPGYITALITFQQMTRYKNVIHVNIQVVNSQASAMWHLWVQMQQCQAFFLYCNMLRCYQANTGLSEDWACHQHLHVFICNQQKTGYILKIHFVVHMILKYTYCD